MMTHNRVSTTKSRVTKISHNHQSIEHQQHSSEISTSRKISVIHVSLKSATSARSRSNDKDKKSINNNLEIVTTHEKHTESKKSANMENSIKRSTSATSSVSVTKVHRPMSQGRQNSRKNTISSNGKSTVENDTETDPIVKQYRFRTPPQVNRQDTSIHQKSTSTDNKRSLGTVEDITNPSHKDHHLAKEKKTKNLIENCFRCTRRRVFIFLLSSIIVGILIAIILAVLLRTSKTTNNKFPITAYLRWNNSGITIFGTTSTRGNTSNQFFNPFGLLLDSFDNLYIADRGNNRIQKCHLGELTCTTIAGQSNAVPGTGMSDLNKPTYIGFDSNNNLYITDTGNERVQFWNYGASYGNTVAGTTSMSGPALNQFNIPYGTALDSNSQTLYVADCRNDRVLKYSLGTLSGTIVAGGNGNGMSSTQLNCPAGIELDPSTNSLIIANFGGSNIVRWKLGDTKWTIVAGNSSGINGNTSTYLDHPTEFIFDPMGNLYVADMFNHRIQLYLVGQTNAITIAGISSILGNNSTMLYYPVTMVLDNQLNLYVADSYNQRIQKFIRY